MTVSNDELSEKLDKVMGKLQDMEQEFSLQMGKYEHINELEEQVEDLQKRVENLEKKAA